MLYKFKEKIFRKVLEKEHPSCVNCSHLEIIDIDKYKVRCPYMINKRCAIENYNKNRKSKNS